MDRKRINKGTMAMNGKGFTTPNLAIAIATALAVGVAVAPSQVHAKTSASVIIDTGRSKTVSTDAIIGTGKSLVLIMGAIDSVDTATNTISVLGRSLKMPSVAKAEEALAAGLQLMVAVSGRMSASGTVEQMKLRFLPTDYVAGSSKVVTSGRVSDISASAGTMKVGGVTVDISSAVTAKAPTAGSLVLIVGTQPLRQGVVLAEQLYVK